MTDRWNDRDLPVLRAIVAAFDIDEDDGSIPSSYSIAQATDLPQPQVERAAENLARGGYIDITPTLGGTMINDITERALREVGI